MGYTIYWCAFGPIVTKEQLDKITEVFTSIAEQYDMTIKTNTTQTSIFVDGACETFRLDANKNLEIAMDSGMGFACCKTQEGKYSIPILTCLIWLMLAHPNMSVSHDGEMEEMVDPDYLDDAIFYKLSDQYPDRDEILRILIRRDNETNEAAEKARGE